MQRSFSQTAHRKEPLQGVLLVLFVFPATYSPLASEIQITNVKSDAADVPYVTCACYNLTCTQNDAECLQTLW
jgi:hypothetical protein